MAYFIKQGDNVDYKYREYVLDTLEELSQIDVYNCCPGSIAYVISTQEVYMLTNKKEWRLQ